MFSKVRVRDCRKRAAGSERDSQIPGQSPAPFWLKRGIWPASQITVHECAVVDRDVSISQRTGHTPGQSPRAETAVISPISAIHPAP